MNEISTQTKRVPITQLLASNAVKTLSTSLSLTPSQVNNAASQAIKLASDPKLARCTSESLIKYCFETARYNFTRDDCIYPVAYGNGVQSMISYKGYREIALQSGYKEVTSVPVYDCDKIYRDRETGQVKVEFEEDYKKTIGAKVVGYYAYAIDKGEEKPCNTLFWEVSKLEAHGKKYSKSYNSIWGDKEGTGFDKMARKTLIKQLCQELRSTPLLQEAIKQDQIVHTSLEHEDYLDNPLNEEKKTTVNNVIDIEAEESKAEEIVEKEKPIPFDI